MTRTFEVVTPEQVAIQYELAGIGSRGLAMLLDVGIQLLFIALLAGVLNVLRLIKAVAFLDNVADKMTEPILVAILILGVFLISWGYYIAFETLWNGETPGKRVMGLRVIKEGGYPLDFRSALIRNLMRAVDALPGVPAVPIYGAGMIAVMAGSRYKRLGDWAAGTLVVRHGAREDTSLYTRTLGNAEVLRLLDATVISQLNRLTRDEYRMVRQFLERRDHVPFTLRAEFALRLAQPLMEKFQYSLPPTGVDYERWLEELDLAYRSHTLGVSVTHPASASTPSLPEPPIESPAPSLERKW